MSINNVNNISSNNVNNNVNSNANNMSILMSMNNVS